MKTLTELFGHKRVVLGTWSQMTGPEAIDILGGVGFDFTIIDAEHGSFGMEAVENLVRSCNAAGLVPIVRIPCRENAHITRALDAGAAGVIVPGVHSVEETRSAIAAASFAPEGNRGACPCVRSAGHWVNDWGQYVAGQARDNGIIVLAETPGALAEVEAICALPGLRALMVGPFDLAVAMGQHGNYRHPEVAAGIRRMLAAAKSAGIPAMMPVFASELEETRRQVEQWRAEGVGIFTIGSDKILFHSQCARFVETISSAGS